MFTERVRVDSQVEGVEEVEKQRRCWRRCCWRRYDKMHCPRCGKENPEDANFCMHCGASLTLFVSAKTEATEGSINELRNFFTTTIRFSELGVKILEGEPEVWKGDWLSLVRGCVFIIVGTIEGCELFDRLAAYKIAEEIEKRKISSLVMTDRYWWEVVDKHGYGNSPIITVGGPISNSLSDKVAKKLGLSEDSTAIGFIEIDGQLIGCAWGWLVKDMLNAVKIFISSYLDRFIEEAMKHKPEIILERIKKLEEEIKRISAVESRDLKRLEVKYKKEDLVRILESFRIVLEILERGMSEENAPTEEFLDKLSLLKNYIEGFSDKITRQVDEFLRFMRVEQSEYLDDAYKKKVRKFCTKLINAWISEFLR